MIFCTVHAANPIFTNITVKSILKFHPTAKIFVVDVTKLGTMFTDQFEPIDDDVMNNVELVYGVTRDRAAREQVEIPKGVLSQETIEAMNEFPTNSESITVPTIMDGDMHHSENIQFAIDAIAENFILIDNDAPLIRPVDFENEEFGTVSDIEENGLGLNDETVFRVVNKHIFRFQPFIQYMNVNYMKRHGVDYYTKSLLSQYYRCAMFFKKPWGRGLHYPTGSMMFSQFANRKLNFVRINHMEYVDHFGGASWKPYKDKTQFIEKHIGLFSNQEEIRKLVQAQEEQK